MRIQIPKIRRLSSVKYSVGSGVMHVTSQRSVHGCRLLAISICQSRSHVQHMQSTAQEDRPSRAFTVSTR